MDVRPESEGGGDRNSVPANQRRRSLVGPGVRKYERRSWKRWGGVPSGAFPTAAVEDNRRDQGGFGIVADVEGKIPSRMHKREI